MINLNKIKEIIGEEKIDYLHIMSATLLTQAIKFIHKLGLLEEFLQDKNESSNLLVKAMLAFEPGEAED